MTTTIKIKDGLKNSTIRIINQDALTSECFLIQMQGPSACEHCEVRGTKECGGKKIRKSGANSKGRKVPV